MGLGKEMGVKRKENQVNGHGKGKGNRRNEGNRYRRKMTKQIWMMRINIVITSTINKYKKNNTAYNFRVSPFS